MYLIFKNIITKRSFKFYEEFGIAFIIINTLFKIFANEYSRIAKNSEIFNDVYLNSVVAIMPVIIVGLFIIFLHGFILFTEIFKDRYLKYSSVLFVYVFSAITVLTTVLEEGFFKGVLLKSAIFFALGIIMILMGAALFRIRKSVGTVATVLSSMMLIIGISGFFVGFYNIIPQNSMLSPWLGLFRLPMILNNLPIQITIVLFFSKMHRDYTIT